MGPLGISVGGLPFDQLRSHGKYYVDKTLLIDDVLNGDGRVHLFTRPRRFGKSTNISMLDAFFNIRYKGNAWFDGLAISEHPEYDTYRNAFPVIRMDLKETTLTYGNRTYEQFLRNFGSALSETYVGFLYLLDSEALDDGQKDTARTVVEETSDEVILGGAVRDLCGALRAHHGVPAMVLIDEYDSPVTSIPDTDLREQIAGFLGGFMSSTVNDNPDLRMAYVTGVAPPSATKMFSGVDNLSVNDVFSVTSDERFGFTEREVMDIMEYYGHPERFEEARAWYDGYRFGNADVYNPFSVMSYVLKGFDAKGYWARSGSDKPVRWMLARAGSELTGTVSKLISGSPVTTDIHLDMTYDDIRALKGTDLLSLMVMTGYLKAVPRKDGQFDVSVPNKEVMGIVDGILRDVVGQEPALFGGFCHAVSQGDASGMESALGAILGGANYYNLENENSYELVLLTIMRGMLGDYDVRSEVPAGNGRADLILVPRSDGGSPSIVIELKLAGSESALDREAEAAIAQIHSRKYYNRMTGKVILVGVSFHGVLPRVRTEVIRMG